MKQWYVLQLVAGNEEKVKNEIERRMREKNLYDFFEEVFIPKEKIEENVEKDSFLNNSGMFPGYVLVKMEPSLELIHTIETIDRVVGFLGGNSPVSITEEEYEKITNRISGNVSVPKVSVNRNFEIGLEVDIASGPFAGFVGMINSIDEEKGKLVVMISIFGRLTPIEVSFDQVKN